MEVIGQRRQNPPEHERPSANSRGGYDDSDEPLLGKLRRDIRLEEQLHRLLVNLVGESKLEFYAI